MSSDHKLKTGSVWHMVVYWSYRSSGLYSSKCSKCRSTPYYQCEKVRAHHARPAVATLASSPPTCAIQDRRDGVQGMHDLLPAYLGEDCQLVSVTGCWRLHLSDIDTCLVQRTNACLGNHTFAAAGPCIWNGVATQLWELDITLKQFSMSTQNAYLVTDSCSAKWQCFSCAVYKLASYLQLLCQLSVTSQGLLVNRLLIQ